MNEETNINMMEFLDLNETSVGLVLLLQSAPTSGVSLCLFHSTHSYRPLYIVSSSRILESDCWSSFLALSLTNSVTSGTLLNPSVPKFLFCIVVRVKIIKICKVLKRVPGTYLVLCRVC